MTALGDWAMGLCAAGVACAILDMLSPGGGLKRVSTMLTALFFFCCLIGPLGEVMADCRVWFSTGAIASAEVDKTLDDTALMQVEVLLLQALETDAAARMEAYGLSVKKVTFKRDMSRADGIYIERVQVVFLKDDHPVPDVAVKELERAFGTSVEVYYTDGR